MHMLLIIEPLPAPCFYHRCLDFHVGLTWITKTLPTLPTNMHPMMCVVKEGESIYVPSNWWHLTLNLGASTLINRCERLLSFLPTKFASSFSFPCPPPYIYLPLLSLLVHLLRVPLLFTGQSVIAAVTMGSLENTCPNKEHPSYNPHVLRKGGQWWEN